MEIKLKNKIKKTIPFTHDRLKKAFNTSKKKNLIFPDYVSFMNYFKFNGCDRSVKATLNPKWRGQMKQFMANHLGKLRKKGYDFDEIIEERPKAGTLNKFTTKNKGFKKVKKSETKIQKESVKVLQECIDLQLKKSQDYQSDSSNVTQAMHYRRGVDTIHDIILGKVTRATSLLESGKDPNFESLEDTYKDMINYASFAVSYMRGKMEGQTPDRDMFNKPKV